MNRRAFTQVRHLVLESYIQLVVWVFETGQLKYSFQNAKKIQGLNSWTSIGQKLLSFKISQGNSNISGHSDIAAGSSLSCTTAILHEAYYFFSTFKHVIGALLHSFSKTCLGSFSQTGSTQQLETKLHNVGKEKRWKQVRDFLCLQDG